MSSTIDLSTPHATPRPLRTARTVAVIATLVATVIVGAGGASANAAPTHLPIVVLTSATAPSSVTLRSVWAALIALPNSNRAHDTQIMKELATVGTN